MRLTCAEGVSASRSERWLYIEGGFMRQLKFRIYDKGRKQWIHDTANAISLFGEYIIMGEILRRPDDSIVSLDELNNLDAMQLTGLLDKNDKEIYEGDIISVTVPGVFDAIVVFAAPSWRMQSIKSGNLWDMTLNNMEVIGNIYDTPELLTQ
jgi:hypothetical protein